MYQDTNDYDIALCNQALLQMGGKRITDFDDSSVEARDCNTFYPFVRDQVLEAFPWRFAKKRATLKMSSITPAFGYSYAFNLPADCLRPLSIDYDAGDEPNWEREGTVILTDEEEVNLHYIARVDSSRFSPSFIRAASLLLASRLAMSVGKDKKLAAELEDKYIRFIEQDAMVLNARSSNPPIKTPTGYVEAR